MSLNNIMSHSCTYGRGFEAYEARVGVGELAGEEGPIEELT